MQVVGEYVFVSRNENKPVNVFGLLLRCGNCQKPSSVMATPKSATATLIKHPGNVADIAVLSEVQPPPPVPTIPEHLPDNIAFFFRQAAEAGSQASLRDAAVMMCRKTLEAALKVIEPDLGDRLLLAPRIRKLAESGCLTSDLADWAEHIRLLGNEAAHETDPVDFEEARELVEFTRLVLIYLFTLPEMVRIARSRRGK